MNKKYLLTDQGIYEKDTQQVIISSSDKKKLRKLAKDLESGKGFNGWTPSFFLKPLKTSI